MHTYAVCIYMHTYSKALHVEDLIQKPNEQEDSTTAYLESRLSDYQIYLSF